MIQRRLGTGGLVVLLGLALAARADERPKRARHGVPPGTQVLLNLAYVKDGHERQKLDLYLPENTEGALPVVVWIHGGGWEAGNKDHCPAVPLVSRGYAVASINYRLSQHAKWPAQINDCQAAVRWLRAHAGKYHLDPKHIGVWGASAGGHLVAMLGTTGNRKDTRVQAVVDWFGPTDLPRMAGTRKDPNSAITKLLGGTVGERKKEAIDASPVTHVRKDDPPFLIMHGDKDPLVPLSQSEELADALKKAGVPATLVVVKGNGHGGPGFNSRENRQRILDFFDKYLKHDAEK